MSFDAQRAHSAYQFLQISGNGSIAEIKGFFLQATSKGRFKRSAHRTTHSTAPHQFFGVGWPRSALLQPKEQNSRCNLQTVDNAEPFAPKS
jgi:hypothetical protein